MPFCELHDGVLLVVNMSLSFVLRKDQEGGRKVMKASEINLKEALQFDVEQGKVAFGSQRMVIFSANAIGTLMSKLMDVGGVELTQVMMRLFGESAGRDDARLLKKEFNPDTDIDWIAMGPTIHTWEGIVRATPTRLEYDRAAGTFFMQGTWVNSFFAEQYLKLYGSSTHAVCWMLAGYATGYVSEFFGGNVMCKETMCKAKGDPHCQFTIKLREDW
jgi:hypothetical protein